MTFRFLNGTLRWNYCRSHNQHKSLSSHCLFIIPRKNRHKNGLFHRPGSHLRIRLHPRPLPGQAKCKSAAAHRQEYARNQGWRVISCNIFRWAKCHCANKKPWYIKHLHLRLVWSKSSAKVEPPSCSRSGGPSLDEKFALGFMSKRSTCRHRHSGSFSEVSGFKSGIFQNFGSATKSHILLSSKPLIFSKNNRKRPFS